MYGGKLPSLTGKGTPVHLCSRPAVELFQRSRPRGQHGLQRALRCPRLRKDLEVMMQSSRQGTHLRTCDSPSEKELNFPHPPREDSTRSKVPCSRRLGSLFLIPFSSAPHPKRSESEVVHWRRRAEVTGEGTSSLKASGIQPHWRRGGQAGKGV